LAFKAVQSSYQPYLTDLLHHHRLLHSTSDELLYVPRYNFSFGSRAFHTAAAKVWNSIPLNIREAKRTFKRHLKTHDFRSFLRPFATLPSTPILLDFGALQNINLLTY